MKKIILSLSLLLMIGFSGFSQSLPIDFDDALDNNFVGQGGSVFSADTNPDDGGDNVGKIVGGTDQYNSRIDLALDTYIDMTTANKTFTFEFYTTEAVAMNGLFQIGNEASGGFPIEMQFSTDGNIGWQTITLDFTNATNGFPNQDDPVVYGQYAQISVFTNFADFGTSTYYVDDIAGAANGGVVLAEPEPMVAAPTPTHDMGDVYSFYSDAYTSVDPSSYTQPWGQGTVEDFVVESDNTKKYSDLNFQAITLSSTVDLAPYTHIHVDVWTPVANAFGIKFQDFGPDDMDEFPNADDSEMQVESSTTQAAGQWVGHDFAIADFTALTGTANLGQIQVLLGSAAGGIQGTAYIDNLYLYTASSPTEPMVAAPTPTHDMGDVYSFYSDAYTSVDPSSYTQPWGQGTVEDFVVEGDNTKKYSDLNFQAITLSSTVDLAPYTHIHVDVWTPVANAFGIKFQDFGPDDMDEFPNADDSEMQVESSTTQAAGQWVGHDFAIADFTALTGTANLGQIQVLLGSAAGGTQGVAFIDNLYLYTAPPPSEPMTAAPTPIYAQEDVYSFYSDAYTNADPSSYTQPWGQGTVEDFVVESDNVKKYSDLNFQAITLSSTVDLAAYTHIHVDVWTPVANAFGIKFQDFGPDDMDEFPNADDSEMQLESSTTQAAGQWVGHDFAIADFTALTGTANLGQIQVLLGSAMGGTQGVAFIDNLYLYTLDAGVNVDFEPAGLGAAWNWIMDANDDNPMLEFIANPVSGGINTTPTVAKFTARQAGASFALTYTDDIDDFQFNATNSTIKIMVHKTVISDFAIKLEGASPFVQKKVANTVVNEWEELIFDFSDQIGNTYNRIVIIPDFDEAGRTQDNIIYFDNIMIPEGNVTPPAEPMVAAPTPTHDQVDDYVLSVYSDTYTNNLAGTDFNPNWGQLTDVTEVQLETTNNTLKYFNLNYQGTQLAAAQDVSTYEFLHLDFWTPNAQAIEFYLISVGSGERKYDLTITAEEWVSVDIPLADYVNQGLDITDIHQFKVVGNGNVWFDNFYFHTENVIVPLAEPTVAAPTPTHDESANQVISIYSGAYTNVNVTDFNPNWGQQTTVEGVVIDNDFAIKYNNLDYQGLQFANQDVSGLDFLHIDFWTPNSTDLGIYLISETPSAEHEYVFTVVTEEWVSVDIPLSHFANAEANIVAPVNLSDVFQFKTEGNGTIYLDNIYFYNSVPLATDLISFQANAKEKTIDLTWETASETNNSHFEVEHTTNGIDFKMIGKVQGNGSSITTSTYGFSHQAPTGVNYYRLRQVDFNGEYKYSEIVKAERTDLGNTTVYPIPAQDLINIDYISSTDEEVKVAITDITGRIVLSQILTANTGENHFNIDISTLPQGSYYLSLEASQENLLRAIIKE